MQEREIPREYLHLRMVEAEKILYRSEINLSSASKDSAECLFSFFVQTLNMMNATRNQTIDFIPRRG
ncbi:hypothetical protein A343_0327 [Porphyromonas gingivalis JCVI SC001]|nr:hypothetical protein A343_0327 [Porphyromonas gingivalis JCVI SC001]